jgi:heptosyltransferase-2
MKHVLILKLGATGDVVRTTPILRHINARFTWVTAKKNVILLQGLNDALLPLAWEERHLVPDVKFDLVINLEDTLDVSSYVKALKYSQLFGAYADDNDVLRYTDDSARWFDLSLISKFGRQEADRLKLLNRHTYQTLIFEGLGLRFKGDSYLLPKGQVTDLSGDIAMSPEAGPVWPMKNWAYYSELKSQLEARGLSVNVLPLRASLLEHLGDVQAHRCLVSGDSLPMHFALGTGTRCVSLFTCTSPHEIHDYGIQQKLVSPLLAQFFFKRGYDRRATTTISVEQVLSAVMKQLESAISASTAGSKTRASAQPQVL